VLVGTTQAVVQLQNVLAIAEPKIDLIGCVLPAESVQRESDHATLSMPVLGSFEGMTEIVAAHEPVDQVLITLPLAMGQEIRGLMQQAQRAGLPWRFMPTLADQLAGGCQALVEKPGDGVNSLVGRGGLLGSMGTAPVGIEVSELIQRRPRPLDERAIHQTLAGRCVMITGAGGSIGSELARMVARFGPSRLVLVERSENALFQVDGQIRSAFADLPRAAVLHDVTDHRRTLAMVQEHNPQIIFHAAAHKHVPMMEDHPSQAVENNFYGTRSIADAAAQANVERFVMISSDKAVNPSSVMGATKRLAELYIQHLNHKVGCIYSMVRFGNVLGSACSVLPIWSEQLAQGGPITLTHRDMQRYFMTIPEAAGLVLQSATLATGGEVFLLDMGDPVRIVDLADRFVRSHGLEPGVDVEMRFTGRRPGEKLFEELAYAGEDMLATDHESVHIWRTTPPGEARINQIITAFDRLRSKGSPQEHHWEQASRESIIAALRLAIPEMVQAAAG